MTFNAGTRLGPYEILEGIGAGGMGEVYRARDTRLGREVAIKALPGRLAGSTDARQRLEREARAVAALNHPNICSIFDVGEHEGDSYTVMELLKGQTLAQRLAGGPLPVDTLFNLAVEVAEALDAAHSAGIIHRDIKPANIFITDRGHAKVLDFGLAKSAPAAAGSGGDSALTLQAPEMAHLTSPGAAIGTVAYMSPEQALGHPLDARTDIFSLGVVLYEMTTGRQPFAGTTTAAVFNAILNLQPVAPARLNPATPEGLERAIARSLEKDAAMRYQHASDLAADLKRIRRDGATVMAAGTVLRSTPAPAAGTVAAALAASPAAAPAAALEPPSDSQVLAAVLRRHRGKLAGGAALLLMGLGAAGYALHRTLAGRARAPAAAIQISRLTTSGDVGDAAISADGKYVVYDTYDTALWLRQTDAESRVQILPPSSLTFHGVAVSPDGSFIYFSRLDRQLDNYVLYRVPILGGPPQTILPAVVSPPAFSPDGRRMAFIRFDKEGSSLLSAALDGSNLRTVATVHSPSAILRTGVSWSSDGGSLVVAGMNSQGKSALLQVPAAGGDLSPIPIPASPDWALLWQAAWLPPVNGTAPDTLLVNAFSNPAQGDTRWQLWEFSAQGRPLRQILNDLGHYAGFSLASKSAALLAVQAEFTASIWTLNSDGGDTHNVSATAANEDGENGLAWTPDRHIIYASEADGLRELHIMDADGAHSRSLSARVGRHPLVTADGRTVLFASVGPAGSSWWTMNSDGTGAHPLVLPRGTLGESIADSEVIAADITPDGKNIVYSAYDHDRWALRMQPVNGGPAVQLADIGDTDALAVSPDGNSVAVTAVSPRGSVVRVIPLRGGRSVDVSVPHHAFSPTSGDGLHWSADGRGFFVVVLDASGANLWKVRIDGTPPVQLTHFTDGQGIYQFAVSPDGRQIAVSRGWSTRNAVLIRNFH